MPTLRPAHPTDAPAIAALHAESWRLTYRGILSDAFLDNEVVQERQEVWQQRLQSPAVNQHVIVAEMGGEIAGFACLLLDDDPVFGTLLDNLHVSAKLQKSGIGRRLMQACAAAILKKSSDRKIYLWVYESNKNARDVYEHLGARCFETIEKRNEDGTMAQSCRYVWDDVSVLV